MSRPSPWDFDRIKVEIKYVGTPEETAFAYDLLTTLIAEAYLEGRLQQYQKPDISMSSVKSYLGGDR